jgi:hypothetical protein
MARHSIALFLFVLAVLSGCDSKLTPVPVKGWSSFHTGRYTMEVETEGLVGSSVNFHFTDDGKGNIDELVELSWGDSIKLRIVNGKLTINGVDRGTLSKEDRIKVDSTGKVLVNGAERK